jgi:hypothetical protein
MTSERNAIKIPMQVGSELRIKKTGEIAVSNPEVEVALTDVAADAVLSYRLDPDSGEHVITLLKPVAGLGNS